MADIGPAVIRTYVAPSREQAAQLLTILWADISRVGLLLQQLDEPVVRHHEWGELYADVQGALDAMEGLLFGTLRSPYPAEAARLKNLSDDLALAFQGARYAVRYFEWDQAVGYLYHGGVSLYQTATLMGVDL